MSSFMTLPSFPVAFTWEMSIPCLLAIDLTAGVARALWFDSSTALERGVRPTGLFSSDEDEDEEELSAFFSEAAGVAGAFPTPSSSTSISMRALPTGQISSF